MIVAIPTKLSVKTMYALRCQLYKRKLNKCTKTSHGKQTMTKLSTMQSVSRGITFSAILDENTNVPNTWLNENVFLHKIWIYTVCFSGFKVINGNLATYLHVTWFCFSIKTWRISITAFPFLGNVINQNWWYISRSTVLFSRLLHSLQTWQNIYRFIVICKGT